MIMIIMTEMTRENNNNDGTNNKDYIKTTINVEDKARATVMVAMLTDK